MRRSSKGKIVPYHRPKTAPRRVHCLRCNDSFITAADRDGIPLHRLCHVCWVGNEERDAGMMFEGI